MKKDGEPEAGDSKFLEKLKGSTSTEKENKVHCMYIFIYKHVKYFINVS